MLFLMNGLSLFMQGGSSTEWDAQHAFDDHNNGNSSFGFGTFIIMLIIFLIALIVWGNNINKK